MIIEIGGTEADDVADCLARFLPSQRVIETLTRHDEAGLHYSPSDLPYADVVKALKSGSVGSVLVRDGRRATGHAALYRPGFLGDRTDWYYGVIEGPIDFQPQLSKQVFRTTLLFVAISIGDGLDLADRGGIPVGFPWDHPDLIEATIRSVPAGEPVYRRGLAFEIVQKSGNLS